MNLKQKFTYRKGLGMAQTRTGSCFDDRK